MIACKYPLDVSSDSLLTCLSRSNRSKMQASYIFKVVASDIIFTHTKSSFNSKPNKENSSSECAETVWLQNNFEYFTTKFVEFMDSTSQSSNRGEYWNNNRDEILRLGKEEFFAKNPIKWARDNEDALRRLGLQELMEEDDPFVHMLHESERKAAHSRREEAEAEVYHIIHDWCSSGM